MGAADDEADYFAIMGLTPGASEADIRKAYRKQSLALHPDKNRHLDAKVAAARFSEMQLAYEVLMDPAARLAAEERTKADNARRERRGAYEGKRKAMAEELERREEYEKQKRYKAAQDEHQRKATLERLKEEGRRLREQKEQEARQMQAAEERDGQAEQEHARARARQPEVQAQGTMQQGQGTSKGSDLDRKTPPPALGPLDLTVTLRFPADQYTRLSTASSPGASDTREDDQDCRLARALTSRFGKIDSLIFRPPKPAADGKARREATAHATFKTLDAAFAAVKLGSQLKAGDNGEAAVLEDVWIAWAGAPKRKSHDTKASQKDGALGEPARITWMRKHGMLPHVSPSIASGETHPRDKKKMINESDILRRLTAQSAPVHPSAASAAASKSRSSAFPSFSFSPAGATSQSSSSPTMTSTANGHSEVGTFESATLHKMREAERRRVEEAIMRADEGKT